MSSSYQKVRAEAMSEDRIVYRVLIAGDLYEIECKADELRKHIQEIENQGKAREKLSEGSGGG